MAGELVSVTTADHVRLHGFFQPAQTGIRSEPVTAILVHGLGGNFYSSRLLQFLAGQIVDQGLHALTINTRGHDSMSRLSRAGRVANGGAVFERVGDCVHDLAAWGRWVENRRGGPLLLIGHSLGAIKALYAQARQPIESVRAVIAMSATRLNHQVLLDSAGGERFRKWFQLASERVADGQGDDLLSVDFPFPTWMTASAYQEKYGPQNNYDWFQFIDSMRTRCLMLFGEREMATNPAFQGLQESLGPRLDGREEIDHVIVADADHFYAGKFNIAWDLINNWLQRETSLLQG